MGIREDLLRLRDINVSRAQDGGAGFSSLANLSVLPAEGFDGSDLQFANGNPVNPSFPNIGGGNIPGRGGFKFNQDTLGLLANSFSGLGSLAQGYAALKNIGLARDSLDFKKDAHRDSVKFAKQNFNQQANAQNLGLADKRRFIQGNFANKDVSHLKNLELLPV